LEHPEVWPAFGRSGRAHIETSFTVPKCTETLLEIYAELLEERAPGGFQIAS